jgi:hypothetical protein
LFNQYVRRQLQTLTARGETTQDLVNNLFKGYLKTNSAKFQGFIERKKEMYQEGAVDYTPESLMLAAENHFNALKLEQMWEPKAATASTGDDPNTILALQARIKGLEDGRRKTPKNGRGDRNEDGSRRFSGKMAWKANKPKDGEASSKTVGDITYHWCPHHGFWTAHKPSECTLAINALAESNKPAGKSPAKRSLTFAEAAAAVAGNHDDDDDDVDQE